MECIVNGALSGLSHPRLFGIEVKRIRCWRIQAEIASGHYGNEIWMGSGA